MKKILPAILLTFVALSGHGNVLDQKIEYDFSFHDQLTSYLVPIITCTGLSILFESAEEYPSTTPSPENGRLEEVLNRFCGKKYSWEIRDRVIIIRSVDKKEIPCEAYQIPVDSTRYPSNQEGLKKYLVTLIKYRLVSRMYSDISLNYSAMTQRFDNFFDFLVTLMKDRRVLILIYKLDDGYSQEIYQRLNALKEYDAKEIKDPGKPFWQLAFFETPLPPAPPPVYHGETVLDGNELLKCRLRLESVNGKRFRVWLKNVSSQPLEFKDFRKENLLLSDLASDGPYFEVREVMVYYIYPPLESDVPENFTLAPGEEKEFSFPVVGSRFRRGHGWKIFDAKAEETLDFKPTEVEIMKKTNRNYNFYDVAVYFYRDGKKYKAFKQDFVDGITFSQP